MVGDITLQRSYYIDGNGNGYFPQDQLLGLDKDSLSGGLKRMIGHTAGRLSFQESSSMTKQLAGLCVGSKQVERAAEALGEEIRQAESAEIEEEAPCSNNMYLGMDGWYRMSGK